VNIKFSEAILLPPNAAISNFTEFVPDNRISTLYLKKYNKHDEDYEEQEEIIRFGNYTYIN
jgi:hypothetical protein